MCARCTNGPAATPTARSTRARSAPSSPRNSGGTTSEIDASLPYASSLCGACYDVCPVAIDIPEVLVHLRAEVARPRRPRAAGREAGDEGGGGRVLDDPRGAVAAGERAAAWAAGPTRDAGAAGGLDRALQRLATLPGPARATGPNLP